MRKSFIVDSSYTNIRIDKWIRNNLGKVPQSLIEKNLRLGKIKLNKKKIKSSHKLNKNDSIEIFDIKFNINVNYKKEKFIPTKTIIKESENLIIENNDNFIVVNKEAGIPVQGGTKSKKNLIDIFSNSNFFENDKPYSVHRLDKDTSGVFIIAKNRETAKLLTSLFRLRRVHKTYVAVCYGEIDKQKGLLDYDLVRYEGKKKIIEKSKTIYRVIDKNINYTLIELNPITGRKHQLRKQLSMFGHPIYGDDKYVNNKNLKTKKKNLLLHSYKIKFIVNGNKYTFKATPPDYFINFIKLKKLKFLNY